MKIAYVFNDIPNYDHSTASICAILLLKAFEEAGHDVDLLLLLPKVPNYNVDQKTWQKWLDGLKDFKIKARVLPGDLPEPTTRPSFLGRLFKRVKKNATAPVKEYFPAVAFAHQLEEVFKENKPDVLFSWGNWPPAAAISSFRDIPKFAFVGDPPSASQDVRNRPPFVSPACYVSPSWWFKEWERRGLARATIKLLKQFEAVGATSNYHAGWLKDNGVSQTQYVPNIVPDWGGPQWKEKRKKAKANNKKLKINILGNVSTTVNALGIRYFAFEVLPHLKRAMGDNFEVHICGKGTIPPDVQARLKDPCVVRRGFVDDIIEEIRSSDVFFVPTPIKLGIRVRIPYAWSIGSCVVTHDANTAGLPEMKNDVNCLTGSSGAALAHCFKRIYEDKALAARLEEAGRKTYDDCFSYPVTTKKVLGVMERLVEAKQQKGALV